MTCGSSHSKVARNYNKAIGKYFINISLIYFYKKVYNYVDKIYTNAIYYKVTRSYNKATGISAWAH